MWKREQRKWVEQVVTFSTLALYPKMLLRPPIKLRPHYPSRLELCKARLGQTLTYVERHSLPGCPLCEAQPSTSSGWLVHILVVCPALTQKVGRLPLDDGSSDPRVRTMIILADVSDQNINKVAMRIRKWKESMSNGT